MGNRPGSVNYKQHRRKNSKPLFSRLFSSSSAPIVTNEDTNLETFLLVWLDPNVDSSKENLHTQKRLRKILTCLITFDKIETCEQWIRKCCFDEKIALIVSGAYGEEIVPKIHHLSTIITIYVYCLDVERNKIWAKDYSKIRTVTSSTNVLIQELHSNQTNLESVEDSKALKIYKNKQQISSLDIKIASFLAYQLLLKILISPDYISSKGTVDEFIQILRQYSSDDEYGSKLIDEFEQTYESKHAVSWLIRDTPLARFVNKVLREEDINMLFTLRFLLVDIYNQLIENQAQSLNVFKLQLMLKSEMENLKANPGQLLVINGFLFASTNMSNLLSMNTNNDQFETVLFDIQADYHSDISPFAFLRNMDSNINEHINREVLFMCGSIFQVGPLIYENSIWKLQLKLISENDSPILFNMKEKLKENQYLCIIGDLLNQSGKIEKANIFYQRLLYELPKQHYLISQIKNQLSKDIIESNKNSIYDTSFILVNLSTHMNEFALAVINILRSLIFNKIFIIDDESPIDVSQWANGEISIFTTRKSLSFLNDLPRDCKIFLLDKSNNNNDKQKFATIDDLIGRLVDEIIQMYRLQANEYNKNGNSIQAKEYDEKINRIYQELRYIDEKHTINNSSMKISDNNIPILIWLLSNTGNDEDNVKYIEEKFGNYFSTYLTFYDQDDCHGYLAENENLIDIFLIIYNNYERSILEGSRQFSNVKYVYCYGESKTNDNEIITNLDDLRYHLISDLIDYYRKLGEQYKRNKQTKKARDMFKQAQNFCHFLSTNCFLSE